MEYSIFGEQLAKGSGIGQLMDDLGEALANADDSVCMLGGGQPAQIPEMNALWDHRLKDILNDEGGLQKLLTSYDPPQGKARFSEAVASLLRQEYGWDVGPENIGVTAGGQTAFFFLFNILAGEMKDGRQRKIVLPLVPEYIGYADQGLGSEVFRSFAPIIDKTSKHGFKYRIDFDSLEIGDDVAAIAVSRPTNPSANLLTDEEVERLLSIAKEKGVYLIIDNAYGLPFPGIIFRDVNPVWDESMILTMSLSKIGLPGARTGIVVAEKSIIKALASTTAIVGLANPNIGQEIATPLIESTEIVRLSESIVQPFYKKRSDLAVEMLGDLFPDSVPYRIHESEGALFLWIWFEGLPITTKTLYERLKARGVFIIPGEYFFYGLDDEMEGHREQCIRMSYANDEAVLRRGIEIMAEEVSALYDASADT